MTRYERRVRSRIGAWQAQPPGLAARLLARPAAAVTNAVEIVVPPAAVRAALTGVDRLASRLADERSILARAKLPDLDALRMGSLEECDALARAVSRRASWLGGAAGALFGVAGAAGLVADIPTLLALAMRTIHRTGLCYGERPNPDSGRRLGLTIFALVSANSPDEKAAALATLHGRKPQGEVSLARAIGVNLTRRMAPAAVPVLGAALGAAVNAWYLADVAEVARYVFQERWLAEKYARNS